MSSRVVVPYLQTLLLRVSLSRLGGKHLTAKGILSSVLSTPARVSLDEPKPVDSILMFLSGYNTLEYSWVKATAVSVRLRILFVTLQNTNKLSGAVAGER